jgi:PIN domain nuclease of toxin-antitoxin system
VIVLDTHIVIWDALQPERLSEAARQAIDQANQTDGSLLCDISLWEIAMLMQKGRLKADIDPLSFINLLLQANRLRVQPITPVIAAKSTQLPDSVNKDPADRLIVATALVEQTVLVTADENLRQSEAIKTLW